MDKIKALIAFLKTKASSVTQSDMVQTWYAHFQSMRVLWNWVYMALYVWISVFAVLHYPASINTVVMTTGGIVSAIFTGYVASKTYERCKGVVPPEDDQS
jgi:hypothetical protein